MNSTTTPMSATLVIEGMSCGGCVAHVTRALKGVPGLEVKSIQVGSAVVAMADEAALRAAVAAVTNAGFRARSPAIQPPGVESAGSNRGGMLGSPLAGHGP